MIEHDLEDSTREVLLDEMPFDRRARNEKGRRTEDAGLAILHELPRRTGQRVRVIERVAPWGVGELDAVICTDSGIVLVDLKRWGVRLHALSENERTVLVEHDSAGRTEERPNPLQRLHRAGSRLIRQHLQVDHAWREVKRHFLHGLIPISYVVCFGPTTDWDDGDVFIGSDSRVCSTRTLRRTIEDLIDQRDAEDFVVGVGADLAALVERWPRWGILTNNRCGFLRCSPMNIEGIPATLRGLDLLESDGDLLQLGYSDRRRYKAHFVGPVRFLTYVDGEQRVIVAEPGQRFRWRLKGR